MRITGLKRRSLLGAAGGIAATMLGAPAVIGQTKSPYAGQTIRVSVFAITYYEYLKDFCQSSRRRPASRSLIDIQAFPVYNQRTDLELSTGGCALDVVNRHLHLFRALDRRRLGDQSRSVSPTTPMPRRPIGTRRIS